MDCIFVYNFSIHKNIMNPFRRLRGIIIIAYHLNLIGYYDLVPPREAFPRAKEAAEKAIDLDENLAEAHTSLAIVKIWYEWDWTGAENSFKRAIR